MQPLLLTIQSHSCTACCIEQLRLFLKLYYSLDEDIDLSESN